MTNWKRFGRKWLYHLRTGTGRVSVLCTLSEILDAGQNPENKQSIVRTLQRIYLYIHSTFGDFEQCFGTSNMSELFSVSAVMNHMRKTGEYVYHISDLN
jgi:hypothetical protein